MSLAMEPIKLHIFNMEENKIKGESFRELMSSIKKTVNSDRFTNRLTSFRMAFMLNSRFRWLYNPVDFNDPINKYVKSLCLISKVLQLMLLIHNTKKCVTANDYRTCTDLKDH